MIEIKGKYNTAKIFTDNVDSASIAQVTLLMNQEFVKGNKIRLMPDIHAGAGCTIGTTMTIRDKIVPNLVGVDIGCGMTVVELHDKEIDFSKLDEVIKKHIPSGFSIRDKHHAFSVNTDIKELKCYDIIQEEKALRSIGTLGGGKTVI